MRIWIAILGTMSIFCGVGCSQKSYRTPAAALATAKSDIRSSGSQELRGGATSGGGDEVGIEVSRALRLVVQMIEQDRGEIYPAKVKNEILSRAKQVKILIEDNELPVRTQDIEQKGIAFSSYNGREVLLRVQRDRWNALKNPTTKDSIIHHELAVLAGYERTGRYDFTDRFAEKRKVFWEKARGRHLICSFSLIEKNERPQWQENLIRDEDRAISLGRPAGSVVISISGAMTESNQAIIRDVTPPGPGIYNQAVIVSYVISTEGYLRAVLSEATVQRQPEFGRDNVFYVDHILSKSPEVVYYSPYEGMDSGASSRFGTWGKYYTLVSCTKL